MSDIALTSSMRRNLMSLQDTQMLQDMTTDRLSTGRKVNSALDNPSSFFTAQGLTNRSKDLSSLLDSMGQGIQTIKAAEKGMNTLNDLVDQAKAVADEAFENAAAAGNGSERAFDLTGVPTTLTLAQAGAPVQSNFPQGTLSADTELDTGGNGTVGAITFVNANDSADTFTFTPTDSGTTYGNLASAINAQAGLSATVNASNTLVITNENGDSYNVSIAGGAVGTATAALASLVTNGIDSAAAIGATPIEVGANADLGEYVFSNGTDDYTVNVSSSTTYASLAAAITSDVEGLTATIGASGLEITNSTASEFTVTQTNAAAGATATGAVAALTSVPATTNVSANDTLFASGVTPENVSITTDQGTAVFETSASTTVTDLVDFINQEVSNVSAEFDNGQFTISGDSNFTIEGLNDSVINTDSGSIDGYNSGNTITLGRLGTETFSSTLSGTLSIGGQAVSVSAETGAELLSQLATDLGSDYDVGVNDDSEIEITYIGSATGSLDVTASSALGSLFLNDASLAGDSTLTGTMTVGQVVDNSELIDQFNDLLAQIDAATADAGYKGINLLNGSNLTVNFNEDRTSSIQLQGVTFDAEGLGIELASGWKSTTNIQESLDQARNAVDGIRDQTARFGREASVIQTRESFTEDMIGTLDEGADKLTLADMNEEAANMLALQTRQQLASNSLSMASQAAQSVMSLFR